MIMPFARTPVKRIVLDIDTQQFFFREGSSTCVRGYRNVLANVLRVINWAQIRRVPRISTVQVLDGGSGESYSDNRRVYQQKIGYTIRGRQVWYEACDSTDLSVDLLNRYKQIIFEKRCFDPFEEPRADRMLSEVSADEFVIVGASAEGAIKATALGLISRGKKVTVLADAVGSYHRIMGELALRILQERGARLTETRAYLNCVYHEPMGWYDWDWR